VRPPGGYCLEDVCQGSDPLQGALPSGATGYAIVRRGPARGNGCAARIVRPSSRSEDQRGEERLAASGLNVPGQQLTRCAERSLLYFAAVLNLLIRGSRPGVRLGLSEEWLGGLDDPQRLFTQPSRGPRCGGLPTPVRGAPLRWGFRRRRRRRATRAPWPRRSSRRVQTGPHPPQSRPPRRGAG